VCFQQLSDDDDDDDDDYGIEESSLDPRIAMLKRTLVDGMSGYTNYTLVTLVEHEKAISCCRFLRFIFIKC